MERRPAQCWRCCSRCRVLWDARCFWCELPQARDWPGLFRFSSRFLRNVIEPGLQHTLGHVPGLGWLFSESVRFGNSVVSRSMPLSGRDLLCGGLVLAIMILPIIIAVARDVLRAVPREQIE